MAGQGRTTVSGTFRDAYFKINDALSVKPQLRFRRLCIACKRVEVAEPGRCPSCLEKA